MQELAANIKKKIPSTLILTSPEQNYYNHSRMHFLACRIRKLLGLCCHFHTITFDLRYNLTRVGDVGYTRWNMWEETVW